MDDEDRINSKPTTEVVEIKTKNSYWKFLIAFFVIIILIAGFYWLWISNLSPEAASNPEVTKPENRSFIGQIAELANSFLVNSTKAVKRALAEIFGKNGSLKPATVINLKEERPTSSQPKKVVLPPSGLQSKKDVNQVNGAPPVNNESNNVEVKPENAKDNQQGRKTREADNGVFGTPKRENGPVFVKPENKPEATERNSGGSGSSNSQTSSSNPSTNQTPAKILVNEVQITGGPGKTENDFIELYNPDNTSVNLKGYRLVKRTKTGVADTSIKSWTTDSFIPAHSYYLWANSGYLGISVTPDVTTAATVSNDNGVAIRFGAEETGTIIDSVAWGQSQNAFVEGSVFGTNPSLNQSIQRKVQDGKPVDTDMNANDFELQHCPSPKTSSKSC